jgi:subtilisin family serine protease
VETHGFRVLATYEDLWNVSVAPGSSESLVRSVPGVDRVRFPYMPIPLVVSEGVELSGVSEWHDLGITGEGAEVAVIDVGFQGINAAMAAGELPSDMTTVDFTGYGMESLSTHGTLVAEIVYDMAPGAHLTLLNTYSEVDLGNAKDYCIEHGIHVINHSVGYENTGGHDGTGIVCDIANDAYDHGVLWVNAAGNHSYKHYRGLFVDADSDSLHEFTQDSAYEFNGLGYLAAGSPIWVYLSWYDWPETSEDYDLYLYGNDGAWRVVTSSCIRQTGAQSPTEEIIGFSVPFAGEYGLAVRRYETTGSHFITLLSAYQDLEFVTPSGSILQPADASGALAVAAIHKSNWSTGPQDPYSSQGPTYDGRMKPEISGPSGVATWTGGSGAVGTSVASPHVAGAAALLAQAFPAWTIQEIQTCLESNAIDMGASGQDSVFGYGRLELPVELGGDSASPLPREGVILRASPNPFLSEVTVTFSIPGRSDVSLAAYDTAGRQVVRLLCGRREAGWSQRVWDGRDKKGRPVVPGVYIIRATVGNVECSRRVIRTP